MRAPADPRIVRHRLPALTFAVFLLVIAASSAVVFALELGATVGHVAAHYRGGGFARAKTLDGLLLVAVPHLAAMPIVLFAAAHVVGWARAVSRRGYRALLGVSFGGAALSIACPFLIRYVAPTAAWLHLAAFLGLEAALLAWSALLGAVFVPWRSRVRTRTPAPSRLPHAGRVAVAVARRWRTGFRPRQERPQPGSGEHPST